MTAEPWTDQRLAAAFVDRYDRPAPREVTVATLERVRATARRPRWWPSLDRPTGRRLAAVVAALALVALVGLVALPRTSSEPAGSAATSARPSTSQAPAQNTPYQSFPPRPAVAGFPAVVAGLQVRSIADARALLADPHVRDTELAVAGWYAASDLLLLGCRYADPPQSPIEIRCADLRTWLTDDGQPIVSSDGSVLKIPDPARSLDLRFVPPVDPILSGTGPRNQQVTTPRPVVVVGHFYDERYSRCPAELLTTCEQTFVVDAVATSTGALDDPAATSAGRGEAGRLTASDAVEIARQRLAGSGEVLAVGLAFGDDAPWFTPHPNADCFCPATWFVRGYWRLPPGTSDPRGPGTPVAGWLAVDDATGRVTGTLARDLPAPARIVGQLQDARRRLLQRR
jgi:hypothetical protein